MPKLELTSSRYSVCQFSGKWTALIFSAQIYQKMDLVLEMQKTNVRIRIKILMVSCAPMFRQSGQLCYFRYKFAKKLFLGSEFWKSKSGFRITTSKLPCPPIFRQNRQFWIFWSKFGEIAGLRVMFWFL